MYVFVVTQGFPSYIQILISMTDIFGTENIRGLCLCN